MTFKKVMAQAARPHATQHGHGAGRQTAHDTQKGGVMAQAQKGKKILTNVVSKDVQCYERGRGRVGSLEWLWIGIRLRALWGFHT
jgi:hypothetical protein